MSSEKSLTARYAAVQAVFWMSICVSGTFAAVYLQGLGYNNMRLGAILACGNLLGAVLGPALSARIDGGARIPAARLIPPALTAQTAALLILIVHPVKGAATTVCFTLYIAFCLAMNTLILKLYVDFVHGGRRLDFGAARATGSLAYVLISVLLGALIERTSVRALPLAGLTLCAMQAAFCALLCRGAPARHDDADAARGGSSMVGFLRRQPRFGVLLLGMVLLFFAHNTLNNFFINVAENVGGGTGTMGRLNAFMAAVEIPVMLLYRRLRGRRSGTTLLRVSFAFFTVKIVAVTLAPNVPARFAALLFQAPSFALYAAAIVDYVDEVVPFEDSAKAQSLAYSMTTLGTVLSSLICGRLLDVTTVTRTMLVACAVCGAGTLVAWAGLEKT